MGSVSDVSVDIMPDGIFLNLNAHPPGRNKYWVPYDKYPMFKDAYDFHVCNVQFSRDKYVSYLYWPDMKLSAVCCCGMLQFIQQFLVVGD
jgi:hypothetical protein